MLLATNLHDVAELIKIDNNTDVDLTGAVLIREGKIHIVLGRRGARSAAGLILLPGKEILQ